MKMVGTSSQQLSAKLAAALSACALPPKTAALAITPVKKTKRTETIEEEVCPHCDKVIGEKSIYVDKDWYVYHRPCQDKGPIDQIDVEAGKKKVKELWSKKASATGWEQLLRKITSSHLAKETVHATHAVHAVKHKKKEGHGMPPVKQADAATAIERLMMRLGKAQATKNVHAVTVATTPDKVKEKAQKLRIKSATELPSDAQLRKEVATPTPAQAEAGNYKKSHVNLHGLAITIENPKGSVRSGVAKTGKRWSNTLVHHYGYLKRTEGKDGDNIDVFLGDKPDGYMVYVIDQVDPQTRRFDESKVMLGFHSKAQAVAGYGANYEKNWRGLGKVTSVAMSTFKRWLATADTTKPFHKWYAAGLHKQAELVKTVPLTVQGVTGTRTVEAELADTLPSRLKGMGKYAEAPPYGMFFDIPGPFWMKNVGYPLDIAFLTKQGEVVDVQRMEVSTAPDYEKPRYESRDKRAAYALEVPVDTITLRKGDVVMLGQTKQADDNGWKLRDAVGPALLLPALLYARKFKAAPMFGKELAKRVRAHGLGLSLSNKDIVDLAGEAGGDMKKRVPGLLRKILVRPQDTDRTMIAKVLRTLTGGKTKLIQPAEANAFKGVVLDPAGLRTAAQPAHVLGSTRPESALGSTSKFVESKLVPGIPHTEDLSAVFKGYRGDTDLIEADFKHNLKRVMKGDFILKPKHGRRAAGVIPSPVLNAEGIDDVIEEMPEYMVQKLMPMKQTNVKQRLMDGIARRLGGGKRGKWLDAPGDVEYRVPVLEGKVVPYGSYRKAPGSFNKGLLDRWGDEHRRVEAYVQRQMDAIKDPTKRTGLFGFDVGVDTKNAPFVIEANPNQAGNIVESSGSLTSAKGYDALHAGIAGKLPAHIRNRLLGYAAPGALLTANTARNKLSD